MIRRFGSLYAGHVDIDDVGFDGPPVNDRWLSDDRLASVFDKAESIARTMDRSGYDTMWLAEHHFQREGYECIPNILMLAVHLSHLTERIRFGCGFNVTPTWHPLRLAEDYAMSDHLTRGRVIFGIGRGYHSREVETFGGPLLDNDANRELFDEQVEIIFKALHEPSFSHRGKHYTIPPRVPYRGYELDEITLVPPPRTRPVECYQPIVSASSAGMDVMARYGIKGMIGGGAAAGGAHDATVHAWQEAIARAGRTTELGGDLVMGLVFHMADTKEQAIAEARPFYEENLKVFAPLGFVRGLSDEQIAATADRSRIRNAGLPTLDEAAESGSWMVGPADAIIESLTRLQERYPGLAEVNVGSVVGTPESVIVEQLERFAEEVMPAFKE